MNDNENKTNAPTIDLLPCPFCSNGGVITYYCGAATPNCPRCADLFGCSKCDVWMDTAEEWNTRNEADALRAEVEGLRTAIVSAIRETCDIRQAIRDGKTDNLVVIENSFYVIQDNLEMALKDAGEVEGDKQNGK